MGRPGPVDGYRNKVNIICDFDGSISPVDSTDLILSRFARPQWAEVEQQWVDGLISSRECMYQQVGLLRTDQRSLDALIDEIPLTPGFEEFINFAGHRFGLRPRIVSDGLDYVIGRVLAAHGIRDLKITANRLLFTEDGFDLEFPYGRSDCGSGVCKCAVASEAPGGLCSAGPTILIGDGRSDLCLADRADFVFARRGLILERHCREQNRPYAPYDSFFDIMNFFEKNVCPLPLAGFSQAGRPAPFTAALEIKQ